MINSIGALAGAVIGLAILFDFRNVAIRVYDLMARHTPGGEPDPRFFTHNTVRFIGGVLGLVGLGVFVARLVNS